MYQCFGAGSKFIPNVSTCPANYYIYIPSHKPSVKQFDLGKLYYRMFSVKLFVHI